MNQRITPGPGQESVWDYPRPPALEHTTSHVRVWFAGKCIAESRRPARILETSHPPTYYIPPADTVLEFLFPAASATQCEWKGQAAYFDVMAGGKTARRACWCYPSPTPPNKTIAGWLAFYPGKVDRCELDGEPVAPQPGGYYGGWITSRVVGPFKGIPGSLGW